MIYKAPAISETVKTEVVCPNDTNPMGMLQGGRLVQWMDIAAAVCAEIHAEKICVTAMINKVDFKHPAFVGDIITIRAKITRHLIHQWRYLFRLLPEKCLQEKTS